MYTQLDAVNLCLTSAGQLPVTAADAPHPDAISANTVIDRASKREQARGWWFNEEKTINLQLTDEGFILVPYGAIRVELNDYPARGIIRSDKLYDIQSNTFIWGSAQSADLVMQLDYNDCPVTFQAYLMYLAATEFQAGYEGDQMKYSDLSQHLMKARMDLRREETRFRKLNTRTNPQYVRYMSGRQRRGTGINPLYPGGY